MTKQKHKQYSDEQHYIDHLNRVSKEAMNVCNRIDCTKYQIPKKDRNEIILLLNSLIEKTKKRMEEI